MGHGFNMSHDVSADGTVHYADPCCVTSQKPRFTPPGWNVEFCGPVCLPHLIQHNWDVPAPAGRGRRQLAGGTGRLPTRAARPDQRPGGERQPGRTAGDGRGRRRVGLSPRICPADRMGARGYPWRFRLHPPHPRIGRRALHRRSSARSPCPLAGRRRASSRRPARCASPRAGPMLAGRIVNINAKKL